MYQYSICTYCIMQLRPQVTVCNVSKNLENRNKLSITTLQHQRNLKICYSVLPTWHLIVSKLSTVNCIQRTSLKYKFSLLTQLRYKYTYLLKIVMKTYMYHTFIRSKLKTTCFDSLLSIIGAWELFLIIDFCRNCIHCLDLAEIYHSC